MNSIPLISNVPVVNFSMNRGNASPEVQMRQEINTSLVALKKEAGTLEGLISEALQILDEVNNRIATLENDTVKKNDVVNVVQSGNLQPVTSNAVAGAISGKLDNTITTIDGTQVDGLSDSQVGIYKVHNYNIGWVFDDGFILHFPWNVNFAYQIAFDDQTNWLAVRYKANKTWNSWKVLSYAETDDNALVDISSQMTLYLGLTSVKARRVNNMVYLFLYGVYTGQPTNSAQTILTGLPEKYRPSSTVDGLCALGYSNSYVTAGRLLIRTDGIVSLQETAWLNNTAIRAGIIYFI